MKILKYFVLALLINASMAMAASKSSDYYDDYSQEEGLLLFKIRGFYASTNAKLSGLPAVANPGTTKPGKLAQSRYGIDGAATIFVTDNFAAEISIGIAGYQTKSSTLVQIAQAYGNTTNATGSQNQILMFPVTVTAQYHLAPFGGIRPYLGAGYNGTYIYTRSKTIKTGNGYGPVVQVGVDFISKDDTIFTFDVRQYFMKSKVEFKSKFLNTNNNVTSKVTWNPLVFSAGIGFKF